MLCLVKTVKKGNVEAIEEHEQWIPYVESRDKEATLRFLQQHINNTKARTKEGFITFLD